MRQKKIVATSVLIVFLGGVGTALAFWWWQRDGYSVEELLARIELGMESQEVIGILGDNVGNDSFTKNDHFDGPPSMRPAWWDQVAVGTTVIHWYFPERNGLGVVALNALDMKVLAKWYVPRNRKVSYG
jgi:hypothetical protein